MDYNRKRCDFPLSCRRVLHDVSQLYTILPDMQDSATHRGAAIASASLDSRGEPGIEGKHLGTIDLKTSKAGMRAVQHDIVVVRGRNARRSEGIARVNQAVDNQMTTP